jgi:hypothetical protein
MKKQILLLALTFVVIVSQATVRTVNNNPSSVAQFVQLQDAINASSVGDTIYVIGSPNTYGNINVSKKLVFIGAGYSVTGTPYNYNSLVGSISIDSINGGSVVSGLKFTGLYITNTVGSGTNTTFVKPHVTFERCRFDSYVSVLGSGWLFRDNFINTYLYINNFENIIISNNIIYGYLTTSNKATVLINNNDFIACSYGGFVTVTNALITNNIFYQIQNFYTDVQNNTFNKNIGYHSTNIITLPPTNNTGSGNISNTNPNFVNVPTTAYSYYENTYDYNLQGGSPAINAGTDGKDLGIFGSANPAANVTGVPHLPQVVVFDINNSVLPKNGTLNVNVKARKQN